MSTDRHNRKHTAAKKQQQPSSTLISLPKEEKAQEKAVSTGNATGQVEDQQKIRWYVPFFKKSSVTDWCLVAFTAVLAVVGIYQLSAMRGQLWEMEVQNQANGRQFTASHRPWMGGANQKINIGQDGTQITWSVEWKNFGSSPAFGVDYRSSIVRFPQGVDWPTAREAENGMAANGQQGVIFPEDSEIEEATGRNHIGITAPPLETGERDRIITNKETVILLGKIAYRDEGHTLHSTIFCREFRPALNGMPDALLPCQLTDHAD